MASRTNNINNKKNNTSKKSSSYKRYSTKKQQEKHSKLKYEIIMMSFVAIGLFFVLSIYFNLGGFIGKGIRNFLFGSFGIGAYLIPVFIVGASFLKVFNKDNRRLNNKLLLLAVLVPAFSSFTHILYIQGSQININIKGNSAFFPALLNYYSISSKLKIGGGLVGGLIGDSFALLLGKAGSILVLLLINISIFILITEKSLFKLIKFIYKKVKNLVVTIYKNKENKTHKKDINIDLHTNINEEELHKDVEVIGERKEDLLLKSTIYDTDETLLDDTDNEESENEVNISFFKNDTNVVQETMSELKSSSQISKPIANKTLYEYPPLELLKSSPSNEVRSSREMLHKNAEKLEQTLESFGVQAKVLNISYGPTVTRYELQPDQGVKVSKIVNLADDIALNLAASGIRMEAPIPGKALIGIEVPNKEVSTVHIKEVIDTVDFKKFPSKIAFGLGKDISGKTIIADIAKMPHLLISGSTGSGKSVCINTLITSILYKADPNDVKLLMIDPKVVELKVYNGIPHLLIPVVTDPKKAAGALYWAVQEMSERYQLFANANVRDLAGYNKYVKDNEELSKLPQIVIIVDELADLMQVAAKDVEDAICRLAQMARAAGIHLILATQRPSVDVITGIIKANIPSRIAFAVSSGVDSRTIIDMNGAEKLVGKGDMLYYPVGMSKPVRVQGSYISDKEVEKVVNFLKASQKANYSKSIMEKISKDTSKESESNKSLENDTDEHFNDALKLIIDNDKASASMLQRRFRIGYNRAARIIDQLFEAGYIGPDEGSKPRKVNITLEEYYRIINDSNNINISNEE